MRRKGLALLAKLGVVALLVWAIRRFLLGAIEELRERPVALEMPWLVVAGTLYLLAFVPTALFWRHVLRLLGCPAAVLRVFRAYYVGHLGKYVPGKAMVVAIRVALVRQRAGDLMPAVVSVFYETQTMIAIGGALGGLLVAALHREQPLLAAAGLAVAAAAGLPLVPAVFLRVVRTLGLARKVPALVEAATRLRLRDVAPAWPAVALGWLVLGASLLATVRGIGGQVVDWPREMLTCTAVAGLAIAGGFFSMLPGGVGVREALIIPLLAPRYGDATALAAAVLWRVVSVVAELLLSAILYPMRGAPRDVGPVP